MGHALRQSYAQGFPASMQETPLRASIRAQNAELLARIASWYGDDTAFGFFADRLNIEVVLEHDFNALMHDARGRSDLNVGEAIDIGHSKVEKTSAFLQTP